MYRVLFLLFCLFGLSALGCAKSPLECGYEPTPVAGQCNDPERISACTAAHPGSEPVCCCGGEACSPPPEWGACMPEPTLGAPGSFWCCDAPLAEIP